MNPEKSIGSTLDEQGAADYVHATLLQISENHPGLSQLMLASKKQNKITHQWVDLDDPYVNRA